MILPFPNDDLKPDALNYLRAEIGKHLSENLAMAVCFTSIGYVLLTWVRRWRGSWSFLFASYQWILITFPMESGRAIEDLRASLFNELRTPDGAKRLQQRVFGPTVALSFNFLVSVGIILMNKLVSIFFSFSFSICFR